MDLKYLNTFKTILETGSFLQAARKLTYTQSTVTFQVQQLEQDLAVKLFEKIGRKMVLTQAGKELLPYVDAVLQAVGRLESYGKDVKKLGGTLKVAVPETLLTYRMQPVLKAFRQRAPCVRLAAEALNCYEIRDRVLHGGVDIGVHYDVGGYGSTVETESLAEFSIALVASSELDGALSDFATPGQRKPLCLILNDGNSIFQEKFRVYLRERDIVPDGIMELGSVEAVKRSVASDLGVACLPRFTVEEELAAGALKEIELDMTDKTITAVCSCHKNKWVSPAMELFMRLLRENLWMADGTPEEPPAFL